MKSKLTTRQAFNAMRRFLEGYYERTSSDDVGSLLGIMQFLEDNSTADSAVWSEWLECVKGVLENKNEEMEGMFEAQR